jgi:hypothetical protein
MSVKAVFVHRMGPDAASFRYRAAIPAREIGGTVNGGEAQVVIFSKPTPDDVTLAKSSKADGLKIVLDVGDDHFNHAVWGPVYQEMVGLADALVTPTENMAGRLMKYFGRTADAIIPDPYEEAYQAPHANGAARFLWFGHANNLKDLRPWQSSLTSLDLTIVTRSNHRMEFDYLQWSTTVQTEQLTKANVVLLPVRKGVEFKSANRLVNALRAGCFVVGSGHPSHYEFRKFIWTGNFPTGIAWTLHFKDELNDRVAEGQQYIEKFSPASVGKLWVQLLERLCE